MEGRRVEPGDREDPWYSTARAAGSRGPQAAADVSTETPRAPTPPPADTVIDGLGTNEVRDLVVRIVSDRGIVSASDLAAMIGVPKMEARGLLTDLSVAGRLAKTGGRDNPLFAPPDPEPPTSPPTRTEVPGGPARSRLRTTPRPRGGPPPPPPDFVQSEASRRQQMRKIADEMQRLGAVEPAFDAELIDDDPERGGAILCIAELFWADGVRGDGGKKVVLELDPEEADLDRLRELKFRVFTTIAELRTIMTAEFQGSHRAGGSR